MSNQLLYYSPIETAINRIESLLEDPLESKISRRSIALLLLQKDPVLRSQLQEKTYFSEIERIVADTEAYFSESLSSVIAESRHKRAMAIEQDITIQPQQQRAFKNEWLHKLTVHPVTGVPILALVLYYGVYQFVGVFGGGTLVDGIEGFFESHINPFVNTIVAAIFPWQVIQDLFANDYGIITLGIRYAVAIVLPVVATFFLMFSLLEDSGYLPRLSLLIDRFFKTIGLSGRSIIPLILGLGCGTMATLVTRTLESKRERIIATLLLALTIPCSAQLGVILGLLSQEPTALLVWATVMVAIFLGIGFLAGKIVPGNASCFYMEIPPLRLPRPQAILTKTYVRLKWYFGEILPLFIFASILIWAGKLTGLFDVLVRGLEPVMLWLGLPKEAAPTFLYGFFRRDYGAAGMFDLHSSGILAGQQLVVAAVTLTLFIPCVAQLQFMFKERGVKKTIAIAIFVVFFAFSLGYLLNQLLTIMELSF
ncbi:Fe2+ transport system protein B [Hyella patelloides LEGE 07179]|uniref:Fe2+ transport system protein B n=1 Tax=Hyella patelloides LEGE 07179 TaxID=945734 RepID=A0A563W130_9CYAN|nr:ferrous iron transporter B [Hyella patelloides]VEP17370.1 Fe2+ transport system protein B [Hyella patelloides LEGE 07179]